MFIKTLSQKLILFLIISFVAFFVNNYYGNLGLFPLDSLGFLDSGYSILKNKHPFKDFWIISGPVLDYTQAIFFKLFGLKWSSFIYHASFFNVLVSSVFFFTFRDSHPEKYSVFHLCGTKTSRFEDQNTENTP